MLAGMYRIATLAALTAAFAATSAAMPPAALAAADAAPTPVSAASPAVAPPPHAKFDRTEPLPRSLEGVGIKEKLNQPLPLDLPFTDEFGKTVRLREFFTGKKPVIINLGYYGCPMLCGLVTKGLVDGVGQMDWTPGQQYEIVTVSIDPSERPALAMAKKRSIMEALGRPAIASGWHFLTSDDERSVKLLAESVGFGYHWDATTSQYAHAAVIVLATPDGRVSRYLYGIQFPKSTLRLSLVEASEGKVGSVMDQLLLFCYHFDPSAGTYSLQAMAIMRAAGLLTMLSLATVIGVALRRENRRSRLAASLAPTPGTIPGAATPIPGDVGAPGRPD
ncbi:MAG: SCO family protein [Planctomycetota bacterium]|nr:SCO family protein [Planctomycetota bacterium]